MRSLWCVLALLGLGGVVVALDPPRGPAVVTFSGAITQTNQQDKAVLDNALLDRLKPVKITTVSPWFKGPQTFEGPLLKDVLALVGASGSTLRIVALNDYEVLVPTEDAALYQPILARRLNGVPLSPRDKGPLFLVYPYDAKPLLATEKFYARSAWQIASIEVR